MSAGVARIIGMAVQSQNRRMTYDEYCRLPEDGLRYELINGELYVTPAPNTRHQKIMARLLVRIAAHLEAKAGGQVLAAPYEVDFFDKEAVQPDLVFVSDADSHIVTEAKIVGVPTLVVEVLSSSARDRGLKRDLYERQGVPEYWILDPNKNQAEIYRLTGRSYGEPLILAPGNHLTTPAIPGLELDLAYIFQR